MSNASQPAAARPEGPCAVANTRRVAGALLVAWQFSGCSDDGRLSNDISFARNAQGWVAGFADYPPRDESGYFLEAAHRELPSPLDTSRRALYVTGMNRSDDLFIFYKGRVGVEPGTTYGVSFELEFATWVPAGCGGVGGSPGDVYVKAGASAVEPQGILDRQGFLRMNVDKGQQLEGGKDALVLGDVTNSRTCGEPWVWELRRLSGGPLLVTADGSGRLWLFVGTDSGYESRTEIYYTRVKARLEPVTGRSGVGVTAP